MKKFPYDGCRVGRRRLRAAALFLALLLAFMIPVEGYACCASPVVTAPKTDEVASQGFLSEIGQLLGISSLVNGILGIVTFLRDTVLPSGFAAVTAATNAENITVNNQIANAATYAAHTNDYSQQKTLVTEAQVDAMMPNQMQACAVLQFEQGLDLMEQGTHNLESAFTALVEAGDCKGTQANCSGAGRVQEEFADLCHLGLLSPRTYGDLTTTMGCKLPPDTTYIDRDLNINYLINTYQMPMAQACILPDGYPYFSSPLPKNLSCQGGTKAEATYNADPSRSQLAWVAAFKYCENIAEEPVTPVYTQGSSITPDLIARVVNDRRRSTGQLGAKRACMRALWERTAVPLSSASMAKAASGSAADSLAVYQKALCDYMVTPPNPNGADISGKQGQPTFPTTTGLGITGDPDLEKCEAGGGLSLLKAKYIINRLCADENYTTQVLSNSLGVEGLNARMDPVQCHLSQRRFQSYIEAEEQNIMELIFNSLEMNQNNLSNAANVSRGPAPTQ